ncbi:MAG: leucyl aminopeptidase family protein [Phycisphaerales bacterium]|nr:leucyl aminopeptidase family protein [Phycisphaerales bacterium]
MFKSIRVGTARSPITVLAVFAGSTGLPRGVELSATLKDALGAARKTPGFNGDAGETLVAGDAGVLLGLGDRESFTADTLRAAAGSLRAQLDRMDANAARLIIAEVIPAKTLDDETAGRAVGEGMGLSNWRVDFFDGTASNTPPARGRLTLTASKPAFKRGLGAGLDLADSVNEARRIAATPPNICNPAWMAKEARRLAKNAGLTCRVITYAEAQRQGMGGIVNVGRGSSSKPCLIVLEHKPARPRRGVRLALVGKTMTYDSGGYSLKISGGMKGMKYDGNGGCAVLGAMLAIAKRKVPIHVTALLPAAENMVAGDAYRPDDIITMYNGVSVEVTNTDAEGRLILGDALAYACKKIKPTAIIDVATLTGGVVVALGSWSAGMFCNDDKLRGRIEAAANVTGERVWRLPLWDDHREFMRSKHADIWNSGPKRDGHPIQGAAFLSFFVDEDVPWAHLDIAGVSKVDADTPTFVPGPTGFGVRLLTEVAESLT